jgi:C1A family cysteine protease
MPSRLNRKYPVVKDKPDPRDKMLAPHPESIKLAAQYTNGKHLGPCKDQGSLGCCTGFSWSSVREFLYRKYFLNEKNKLVIADNLILSPLFLYYEERELEGDVDQDGGAQSRTGAVVLNQSGVCQETEDPYRPSQFEVAPTGEQTTEALDYRAGAYHRIPDLLTLKSVIASGYVASIGIAVYESFESDAAAQSGDIPVPNINTEQLLGGHEVTTYRYDDDHVNADGSKGAVGFLNSWGTGWGCKVDPSKPEEGGAGWLPYKYWNNNLVSDMWIIHLGPPWVPETQPKGDSNVSTPPIPTPTPTPTPEPPSPWEPSEAEIARLADQIWADTTGKQPTSHETEVQIWLIAEWVLIREWWEQQDKSKPV